MTIKDIAEYCGVSVSTVSRVLNHRPDVSDEVRERVMRAVDELHYVPNNSARDLVLPQKDSIGIIVRGADNMFFTPIITEIESKAEEKGYMPVVLPIRSDADELQAGAELTRSKRLRGLLFLGGRFDYTPQEIRSLDVPFVCCTYSNHFGNMDRRSYASVSIDDEAEAYRAVKMLTDRGHKKIAILLDADDSRSIGELRYRGYQRALKEAGIPQDPELMEEVREFSMKAAYEGAGRLLDRRDDFTALFAISDTLAIAAIKRLTEYGKKIPQDCSIIAIDGLDVSNYTIPTLTTLVQPGLELGRQAASMLIRMIEGKSESIQVYMETELREGGTLAEAPKNQI